MSCPLQRSDRHNVARGLPPLQAVAHASGKGSGWPKSLAARRRVAICPEPTASSSLGDGCSPAVAAGARSTLPRSARSTVQGGPRRASPATASITRCSRSRASSNRALQHPHAQAVWPCPCSWSQQYRTGLVAAHRKVDILATAVTMRPCSAAGMGNSAGASPGALASCDTTGASAVAGAGPHACRQVARSPLTVFGTEARRLATHCAAAATCAPAAQLQEVGEWKLQQEQLWAVPHLQAKVSQLSVCRLSVRHGLHVVAVGLHAPAQANVNSSPALARLERQGRSPFHCGGEQERFQENILLF